MSSNGHSKKGKRGGVDCYLPLTNFNPLRFVQISSDMSSWMTASRSWTLFLAEFWVPYFEISQFVDVASWDPFTSKHLRCVVNGSVISCWELRWNEALWPKQTNRDFEYSLGQCHFASLTLKVTFLSVINLFKIYLEKLFNMFQPSKI